MKKINCFDIFVIINQIILLLSLPYIFICSYTNEYSYMFDNFSGDLFEISLASMPRGVLVLLARLYSLTYSEWVICFSILAISFLLGVIMFIFHKYAFKKTILIMFAIVSCADLIIRLIPVIRINRIFGNGCLILGVFLQLVLTYLILIELIKCYKSYNWKRDN